MDRIKYKWVISIFMLGGVIITMSLVSIKIQLNRSQKELQLFFKGVMYNFTNNDLSFLEPKFPEGEKANIKMMISEFSKNYEIEAVDSFAQFREFYVRFDNGKSFLITIEKIESLEQLNPLNILRKPKFKFYSLTRGKIKVGS